ncbi:Choline-sulfatase [Caulifigura coniformis]|uniref:Choline-sulfatase n=1 Tax=Caulifigura coniformis TaxID=2527983 RepID=A0A517SJ38_9PLAN|nr:sulfatase [Caulifigura coniformis]QDT56141.1 Choline-sulfatase [Caulifigura coniformis]
MFTMSSRLQGVMFALLTLVCATAPAAEGKRPNILMIFADDWGRHASAYAKLEPGGINDIVQTPHFDRVAKQGVLFRNAFVNSPSCTPCRSSFMSGQYFWRTGRGAILRGAVWDSTIPSWPLLLRDAGYNLGKTYKVWSPGSPVDAPYGGKEYAFDKGAGQVSSFSETVTAAVANGTPVEDAKQAVLSNVRENFQAFLAKRDPARPFAYWFGTTNTHRKWKRGSGKAIWGLEPDSLKGKLPKFLPDVPEVREDLADYLGEAQALDAMIGILLDELQKTGEAENTLIAISGDHGAPGFPHGKCNLYDFGTRVSLAIAGPGVAGGRVVDDFVSIPDLAPTFVEAGGGTPPAVMTARSLWPVLRSSASGQVDPARDAVYIGRERHVEMAREGFLPYPQRAIRTANHLFIINFHPERRPLGDPLEVASGTPPSFRDLENETFVAFPDDDAGLTKAWLVSHRDDPQWKPFYEHTYGLRPREELYELRNDPDQMNNLAADPAYQSQVADLRRQLMGELERSGDPRVKEDGRFFESPPLAGPLPGDVQQPNRRRRAN